MPVFCYRKDVCVLSGAGTAVSMDPSLWTLGCSKWESKRFSTVENVSRQESEDTASECSFTHISYSDANLPFPIGVRSCAVCGYFSVISVVSMLLCFDVIFRDSVVPDIIL